MKITPLKFSHIKIDFRFLKTEEHMQALINFHQLPNPKWTVEKFMEYKKFYSICWIDPITFDVFAWCQPEYGKQIFFQPEMLAQIAFVPSKQGATIDSILEKIHKTGLDSLSKWEIAFLDHQANSM